MSCIQMMLETGHAVHATMTSMRHVPPDTAMRCSSLSMHMDAACEACRHSGMHACDLSKGVIGFQNHVTKVIHVAEVDMATRQRDDYWRMGEHVARPSLSEMVRAYVCAPVAVHALVCFSSHCSNLP